MRNSIAFALAGASLVAATAATTVAARAQMSAPVGMTPAEFAGATTGSQVQIVVRIDSVARRKLHAGLLVHDTDRRYKTTGTAVDLYFPSDTPIVMGTASDMKPGAVIFVFAVATGRNKCDAKKVVVVTPYVTVE